jgi:two-component system, OmpR family, sensor histidine kinase BaeS
MKFTYKLFTSFLLTSLLIVILMVVVMQYYATRNFSAYVGRVEMEQLSDIMPRLQQEYRAHQSWEHVRGNSEVWAEILRLRPGLDRPPFPQPPPQGRVAPGADPAPNPNPPPHDIRPRLTLFNSSKRPVVGRGTTVDDHVLKEIRVDGVVVGWLGLRIPERLSDPLQLDFLYSQTKAIYLIGGAILALAALLTFILARGLLQPVRQLARGAHALASRRFDTRIEVHSTDELGQLSSDFNHMADTLERYECLRRQWITDVSHELRTPLSVLMAEIDAMLDGVRDMNLETLESIQAEVLLMTKLVDDLHALSLLESDTLSMAREEVDVLKVARDILHAFGLRLTHKGINVTSDLEVGGRLMVIGDGARLAQVFTNLMENTLKYTDTPGRLNITHRLTGKEVLLVFDDSPPAVSPAELPNIFERLYRTDHSRSSSGSGLGLAISKAIIETIGGTIEACASPLGGLRIEIMLPLAQHSKKATEKLS